MAKDTRIGERMRACIGMVDVKPITRLVLAELAYRDGSGGSWPKRETIAAYLGISPRSLDRSIGEATAAGRLRRKRRRRLFAVNEIAYGDPWDFGPVLDSPICGESRAAGAFLDSPTGGELEQEENRKRGGKRKPREWQGCPYPDVCSGTVQGSDGPCSVCGRD